ncbi:MAG TPA: hypothetical protein H9829_02215 [Candidatus Tetragenococcus pullicola]|nr:hypothetical protein [Candidatus Tetragenococcus pullicola]
MDYVKQLIVPKEIVEASFKGEKAINLTLMTFDKNVHKVIVPVLPQKVTPLMMYDIDKVLVFIWYDNNEKIIQVNGKVENETVTFVLPDELRGFPGPFYMEVDLVLTDDRTLTLSQFRAETRASKADMIDENIIKDAKAYYFQLFEDWAGNVGSAKEDAQKEWNEWKAQREEDWAKFEAGSTSKMQELEQRIDEQTEIFNNADVYNKAEIEDKLEPFALRTDIDNLDEVKAEKEEVAKSVSNLSAGKVDKNGASQVNWGMIAQDAREQISGNKVAVVGPKSVSTENVVDKSIIPDKTSFAKSVKNLLNPSKIKKGTVYQSIANIATEKENSGYDSILVDVEPETWYAINRAPSSNFSFACAADLTILGKILELEHTDDDLTIFKTPVNTTQLAVSNQTGLESVVILKTDQNIAKATTAEYPYNTDKKVEIDELYIKNKGYVSKLIESAENPFFENVVNKKVSKVDLSSKWYVFSSGRVATENGRFIWTGDKKKSGAFTEPFESNATNVKVTISGFFEGLSGIDVMIRYSQSDGTMKYIKTAETTDSTFGLEFSFDPNNLAVYNDATKFYILIRNTGDQAGSFTLTGLSVIEEDVELTDIYADNLRDVIIKTDAKLKEIDSAVSNSNADEGHFMSDGLGNKYLLQVLNGNLQLINVIPDKVLVMGNSLLLGINQGDHGDEAFGMCASSSKNDFYYHLSQAIKNKNGIAAINKIHDAVLEQGQKSAQEYLDDNAATIANDLDLIIVQIGDNVSDETKEATFKTEFPLFLQKLKQKCPQARVICVGTWFSTNRGLPIVRDNALKYGCEFIDISYLNIKENQGSDGQVITFDDATTTEAKLNWITHPGDAGMKRIAERIVKKLNM